MGWLVTSDLFGVAEYSLFLVISVVTSRAWLWNTRFFRGIIQAVVLTVCIALMAFWIYPVFYLVGGFSRGQIEVSG